MKKNNFLYGILEKVKGFLRPIYDNGSFLTTAEGDRPKIYGPINSELENIKVYDTKEDSVPTSKTPLI